MSRPGLMALAISGGILPSPTALVVLTAAGSYHRVGYGLGLILAFSVGLATALTVVGLLALRTRSLVSRRFSGRWAAVLPLVSAAVIVGVGLFFTVRGVAQVL
jgi:ABC-type nickel/cobalt efflux system permease component RcnA